MKFISNEDMKQLNLSPSVCMEWVLKAMTILENDSSSQMASVYPQKGDSICVNHSLLPSPFYRYGVNIMRNISNSVSSVKSEIALYESQNGQLLSVMEGDWINIMHIGAIAALVFQKLRRNENAKIAFLSLDNKSRALLLCLLESEPNIKHQVFVAQNDYTCSFIDRFQTYSNVSFSIASVGALVIQADFLISSEIKSSVIDLLRDRTFSGKCMMLLSDENLMNNDTSYFDKVCTTQSSAKNNFFSIRDLLVDSSVVKVDIEDSILCQIQTISILDVYFANKIFEKVDSPTCEIEISRENIKHWV